MFLHRVLPPPASSPLTPPGYSPNVRRDSLQENRIMTSDQAREFSESSRQPSVSPESPSLPPPFDPSSVPRTDNPSPIQPTDTRITRRNYSLSDVYQDGEAYQPNSNSTTAPVELEERSRPAVSPSQVCLCQPDPKVPRPRNAFILFRQHHQAEVAKSNPGLANPEISKIIGEYWRRSSTETKLRWKNLAEEEKARHQKQYPDYRYQPRRTGRGSHASTVDAEPGRCPKCGGGSMTAPRLPSPSHENQPTTPLPPKEPSSTMTPERQVMLRDQRPSPPSSGVSTHARLGGATPYIHSPPPPTMAAPHRYGSGASYAPSYGASVSYPHPKTDPMTSPLISPDLKRRRFDGTNGPYMPRQGSMNTVMGNAGYCHDRRPSLTSAPRPDCRPPSFAYPQPPISQPTAYSNPPLSALPPIRTNAASSQSKSVEAMVMSIAPLGKVRTLSKIAGPLPDPSPTSPPFATRGAIIAVEGLDDVALKAVITHLRTRLQQNDEHRVKLYYGGTFASKKGAEPSFADWLRVIQGWHSDSADIKQFITTIPGSRSSPATSPTTADPKPTPERPSAEPNDMHEAAMSEPRPTMEAVPNGTAPSIPKDSTNASRTGENVEMRDADAPASSATSAEPNTRMESQASSRKRKASEAPSSATTSSPSDSGPIPVAIIPRYHLTLTDVAASTIPIADDYSPVDHWHWIAAMWRGIVGPDITIVVKSHAVSGSEEHAGQPTGGRPTGMPNGANHDGKGRTPDVEVHLQDYRAIVLRYDRGHKVGESALRRVGFEVEEWLRSREERMRAF